MLGRAIVLGVFGFIYSLEQGKNSINSILIVLAFISIGTIILEILKGILNSSRFGCEKKVLEKDFNKAFMMLWPFMIFALVSKFYFKWDMALAFFSTGFMTAGGILTYELKHKTKMKKILPLFISMYLFGLILVLINLNKILERVGGSL